MRIRRKSKKEQGCEAVAVRNVGGSEGCGVRDERGHPLDLAICMLSYYQSIRITTNFAPFTEEI